MPRPVLMPDSNVWAYLVDHGGIEIMYRESKRLGIAVAACPAVGYEFLRAGHAGVKRARMQALCRSTWLRLMPDVFKEAEEARLAISHRRPEWMDPTPQLGRWRALAADWKSGWWYRVRTDTQNEAIKLWRVEGDRLDQAREQATFGRDEARQAAITFDNVVFDVSAVPVGWVPRWWDGEPFDAWRIQEAQVLKDALERPGSGYHDWLSPWINPARIDEKDWFHLWLREVTEREMPLAWLRWAFAHVQATRTTSNGAPVDNQIATYLPECDVFVTADKIFAECIEKVREASPVAIGRAARVPANAAAVDAVVDLLNAMAG